MNKIREWGETMYCWGDGPFSYYDEFLTPYSSYIIMAPIMKGGF